MHELKARLRQEIKDIERSGKLGMGELEALHLLTDTVKNIDKIEMLEGDGGQSYANRGEHWVRGHYSRDGGDYDVRGYDGGYSGRRDSRGRYSSDGGRGETMRHLEAALATADPQDRETLERLMDKMR